LLEREHRAKKIVPALDSCNDVGWPKHQRASIPPGRGSLQFLPVDRRRHERFLALGAQGIGGDGRLVLRVLTPVDEHTIAAALPVHVEVTDRRSPLLQQLGDGPREGLGHAVRRRSIQRHMEMKPLPPGDLGEDMQAEPLEHIPELQRHRHAPRYGRTLPGSRSNTIDVGRSSVGTRCKKG
jgi:hypothetical protein